MNEVLCIHLRAISLQMPKLLFCITSLKIIHFKLLPDLPGVNELNNMLLMLTLYASYYVPVTHWNVTKRGVSSALTLIIVKQFDTALLYVRLQMPKLLFCITSLKIIHFKLLPDLPGVNELNNMLLMLTLYASYYVQWRPFIARFFIANIL